jgi:hypothetical protein
LDWSACMRRDNEDGSVIGLSVPRWFEAIAKSQGLWAAVAVGLMVFALWYLLPQRGQSFMDVRTAVEANSMKLDNLQRGMDLQTRQMEEAARMMHDVSVQRAAADLVNRNMLTQLCLLLTTGPDGRNACWGAAQGLAPRAIK